MSWEIQLAAVRELAAKNGDPEPLVLSDWNKSGRKGPEGRPGYAEMVGMIEAGEVSNLYSYSLSRLSRSLSEFARLVDLCREHDVVIRLQAEPFLDFSSAAGRLMVSILASFAQMEAEIAQERARDTIAARRARGDRIGPAEFDNPQAVIDAFEDAGSVSGAAKLLALRGIKTRAGRDLWYPSAVRSVLTRVAPDLLPTGKDRGVKKAAPFLFYRLLRCPCGSTLTGVRYARQGGYVLYRCLRGESDPLHGRKSVPETALMAWARGEAALLSPPETVIQLADDVETQRNALLEGKRRTGKAFQAGAIEDGEFESEIERLDRALMELDAQGRAVNLEPITWDREPRLVNAALRAIWSHVQLDEDQRPVFAEWLLPDWRRAAPEQGSLAAQVA